VHRIGRTGRAGAEGKAITFVTQADQRKLRFLERAVKMEIAQMQVPSDAEVAAAERGLLVKDIKKVLAKGKLEDAREWLSTVLEDGELSSEDVAAAAVMLLAERQGLNIRFPKDTGLPHWAKKDQSRQGPGEHDRGAPRGDFRSVNEVEIFFSIGRIAGVRAGDIVGAIANEVGIPGRQIGKVSLFDHKTFVGLSKENAEQLLAEHPTLEVRGKHVQLKLARPRNQGSDQRWDKKNFDDKGGKRPWKSKKSAGKGPTAYKGGKKGGKRH
jgi:ATP-dependent RNA helicase DeaD